MLFFWGWLIAPLHKVGRGELWCRYVLFILSSVGFAFLIWFLSFQVLFYGLARRGALAAGAIASLVPSIIFTLFAYKGEVISVALGKRLQSKPETIPAAASIEVTRA